MLSGFEKEKIRDFQVKRQIIYLYKSFLIMLEDLEEDHIQHFDKLYKAFKDNKEVIKQADYFSQEKMTYLRKKVLDAGNDCIRNVIGEKYDNNNNNGK